MVKKKLKTILCSIPQDIFIDREYAELPIVPKIAIVSLIKWIKKFGYQGDFYDIDVLLPSEKEIFDYFKSKQPDVAGISAVVSSSYLQVKKIANIIRKACKSTTIILGGNMSASANVLLRKTEVDICVLGDGEKTFVSLLNYIEKNKTKKKVKELLKIRGIAFINNRDEMEFTGYGEPIQNTEIPVCDYEILSQGLLDKQFLFKYYFKDLKKCDFLRNDARTFECNRKSKLGSLWVAKGCPNRCTFCQKFCAGYHPIDLKKIEKQVIKLKNKYDVQAINLIDDNFGINKEHAFKVAKILKKHDMLWFSTGVQCTNFTLEDMKFLKECGCTALKFGVESGSKKIFDVMEKGFTKEDVYIAVKNAHKCGFYSPSAFCVGMPGENNKTIIETGKFLGKISKMTGIPPNEIHININYALPLPGAPLYEYGRLRKIIGNSVDEEEKFLIYLSDRSAKRNNFINLTGREIKDILFWGFLLQYEAMCTFYSKRIKKQDLKVRIKHKKNIPFARGSVKFNIFRFFLEPISGLNWLFVKSPLVAKFPRFLIYPIMKNLVYLEYKIQKNIIRPIIQVFGTRIEKYFGLPIPSKKILKYLNFPKLRKCKSLNESKSLREINKEIREKLPPPKNLTEKNQQILLLGR